MHRFVNLLTSVFVLGLASVALAQEVEMIPRAGNPPELFFEAPDELQPVAERLAKIDPESFRPTMNFLGLGDAGPPIRVVLAPEGSEEAQRAPGWAVGYAISGAGLIVLMPARNPTYPDDSLEATLRHEVAHVLIHRASGRRGVPRWFNEGLAMIAGREWELDDRGRLIFATLEREDVELAKLDGLFYGEHANATRGYALSGAFVRYLIQVYGPRTPARILRRIADGRDFPEAFWGETGWTLSGASQAFWRHLNIWHKWVPLVGSSTFVWLMIALLALVAFKRRRDRDEEIRERWAEEERAQEEHEVAELVTYSTPELLSGEPSEETPDEWIN